MKSQGSEVSMAQQAQPLGHSGKLSDNTLFQCDNDDIMANMWELSKKKEQLQQEMEVASLEIDGWLQVLNCSSAPELEAVIEELTASPTLLPPAMTLLAPADPLTRCLKEYSALLTSLSALQMMDCAQGYQTREGNLFLKFPWRPPNHPHQDCLLLLRPGSDHTYSIVSHNLPPTVPVQDLEKNYLQRPQGPEGLRKFVAVVGQYTKALYSRLQQIMALESSKVLGGTSVQRNKGATNLSFIVNLKLKDRPLLQADFVLKYHPLDVLPHTVTAKPLLLSRKDDVPARLQDSLDQVARRMLSATFPQVLLEQDRTAPSSSSSTHTQQEEIGEELGASSSASSSSASGLLFDLQE